MAGPPTSLGWQSPISYDAQSSSALLRRVLEEQGFRFSRGAGQKLYSRNLVVIPMPLVAYVYRLVVTAPVAFTLEVYDTCVTSTGSLTYLEVPDLSTRNRAAVRRVLGDFAGRLRRKPWVFPWLQRFQLGVLLPEFFAARRAWRQLVPEA